MNARGGSPSSPTDWVAKIAAIEAGDRVAFAEFSRLITGFLVQFRAYDFEDEWDDLRQEVLHAVLDSSRKGRLRDAGAFVGYARMIARNKFVDRLKRRIRRGERDALPWEDEIARDVAAGAREEGAVDTVGSEMRRDLVSALGALPERDRELIERVYVAGETYDEASRSTGVPLGTLKRRLREGLAAMRTRLEGATE